MKIARVELPEFGAEAACPAIPLDVYRRRMADAVARMERDGLDCLVVYADREHFANMAFLTGFDPRFEEALLLLDRRGHSLLMVGNECMGYLPAPELKIEVELFQEFSLMGQPRESSRPLRDILSGFGIGRGARVGCVGWKCYGAAGVSDVPSYIVDAIRDLTGDGALVVNATGIFTNLADGLRIVCEPEQIAQFEHAATVTSGGIWRLLRRLREGIAEQELERHLDSAGLPLSCHRMISFGEKAGRGLSSPGHGRARLGDPYTTALGVTGSLTCRAGCIARGPEDLPAGTRDFYSAFASNYFDVVAAWYETVRVGATGGEVFSAVEARRDDRLFRLAVNPGHYIHLDEWVNSPFAPGSAAVLRSGAAVQMDIIPVSRGPFCCINAEDGIVLADAALRDGLARRWPALWQRVEERREFMEGVIGIRLHESVLPLGNIPAWLPPYALALDRVLVSERQCK